MGSNPSEATRQTLVDYLGIVQNNVFEPLKTGIFEPDFDPLEFERKATVLFDGTRVRCDTYPDIGILTPEKESKQEMTPVLASKNGELCKYGVFS